MTPGEQMAADFAAFEREHRAKHPAPVTDTLDPYGDDRDPHEDAMYFRAAPYHGWPL